MIVETLSAASQFVERLNGNSLKPSELSVSFFRIDDERLRLSIRISDMIEATAIARGLQPACRDLSGAWFTTPQRVVDQLRDYGDQSVRTVLKEVRSQIRTSNGSGDRRPAFDMVSELMRSLKPRISQLPPFPPRIKR